MNSELRRKRSFVDISVSGYLARWTRARFDRSESDGGVVLPVRLQVWHTVWHLLERGGRRRQPSVGGNLRLHLGYPRGEGGGYGKDPAFWNRLSPRSVSLVERELRRLFYMEFRQWMDARGGELMKDCCHRFCHQWGLTLDDEETVLRTWRRLLKAERNVFLEKKSQV